MVRMVTKPSNITSQATGHFTVEVHREEIIKHLFQNWLLENQSFGLICRAVLMEHTELWIIRGENLEENAEKVKAWSYITDQWYWIRNLTSQTLQALWSWLCEPICSNDITGFSTSLFLPTFDNSLQYNLTLHARWFPNSGPVYPLETLSSLLTVNDGFPSQRASNVRPSTCPPVCHTFFTMFLSSYHREIFRG